MKFLSAIFIFCLYMTVFPRLANANEFYRLTCPESSVTFLYNDIIYNFTYSINATLECSDNATDNTSVDLVPGPYGSNEQLVLLTISGLIGTDTYGDRSPTSHLVFVADRPETWSINKEFRYESDSQDPFTYEINIMGTLQ